MNLTEQTLADIMNGVILLDRSRYSHSASYDIYLSYAILEPYGLRDVAVSVAGGQRTGILLREGSGIFAFSIDNDYGRFRDLLSQHWTDVKEIYVLPGIDMSQVSSILNLTITKQEVSCFCKQ